MKIIKVKKKPWYQRWGIEHWWVWVEDKDGSIERYSCWAGMNFPYREKLLADLKYKIDFDDLVGTEL